MDLRKRDEQGFTLIELMVVVMIIAILIAIAVPTFLNVRQKAQNRQAESNLRNAYTNAKGIYSDSTDWGTVNTTNLAAAEPSLTFQATASTTAKQISVTASTAGIVLAARSASGTCYVLRENEGSGAEYGTGSCDSGSVGSVTFAADPTTGGW